MTHRRGFALLTVLWLVVTVAILVGVAGRLARHTLAMAQRDRDRTAGRWVAEGCIAQARVTLDSVLRDGPIRADAAWREADSLVSRAVPTFGSCDLTTTTAGRVFVPRASAAELASVPGMSAEAVAEVVRLRAAKVPIIDLAAVADHLTPEARAAFEGNYAALAQRATTDPDLWVVRSRAHAGASHASVNVEASFARAGTHAALVRWREW